MKAIDLENPVDEEIFFESYPLAIRCGYSNGLDWKICVPQTMDEFWNKIEYIKPAANRPSHIIFEGISREVCQTIMREHLYVPQIFLLHDGRLIGGWRWTREYFCRKFNWKNGGNW